MIEAMQAFNWQQALQMIVAALLGGIIGYERESTGHDAGFRTNMLIAIGSCLFTVLSIDGFPLRGSAQDTARIAAQIVSGVGFIGAGITFRNERHVKGLTTAATIWLVAAIGMAVGVSAYFLAVFTTLLTTIVLRLFLNVSQRAAARTQSTRKQPNEQ
jgi:putative Mg2+ transporter-C (MgtC) family protein